MSVTYYPLINKIMNTLRLRDISTSPGEPKSPFNKPFITIAREPGSGGKPIAKLLADKLGFEFIDEQIIGEIAESIKKRKAVIKEIDEKARTQIEDIIHAILNEEYVDDLTYITELTKVVLTYALKGHAVILGRGANFICPFAAGLHVNITAPYQVRVQRAMDYEGYNRRKAREVIAETEKERRDFVKQYFRQNIKGINAYDLTLNTTYFDLEQASRVIIEAFYHKFPTFSRFKAVLVK